MAKVTVVLGTRPEAIKLAPLIQDLEVSPEVEVEVVTTGQHGAIADEVLALFNIQPKHDLNLLRPGQTLTHVTVTCLEGIEHILADSSTDAVVVQGDTTSTFAAALAAFYQGVPVVHVEAGLRTGNRRAPFPEEINRRLTSPLTQLHLCPTPRSRQALLNEGIEPESVFTTGNTVVDALQRVLQGSPVEPRDGRRRRILVTAHRRESWHSGLDGIALGLRGAVEGRQDVEVVFPIHPNPIVRDVMLPILGPLDNVHIVEPMRYEQFARLMASSDLVVTDSGGIQEEAPSLGIPVLVTRDNTERPEAVSAGTVKLIGNRAKAVSEHVTLLLDDPDEYTRMSRAVNPYGDGQASRRSVQAIRHMLFGDAPPDEYSPAHG